MRKNIICSISFLLCFGYFLANAQNGKIQGVISDGLSTIAFANVYLEGTIFGTSSDEDGNYALKNIPVGKYRLKVTVLGYRNFSKNITIGANEKLTVSILMEASLEHLEETVVTGTLKAVSRSESPVPVEVYSPRSEERRVGKEC